MKLKLLAVAAAFSLGSAPAAAQDMFGGGPNPFAIINEVFVADPLSAEEEARLPAARQVVNQLFPEGVYGAAMEESMLPLAEKVMSLIEPQGSARVAQLTHLPAYSLEQLSEGDASSIVAMLDPQGAERNEQILEIALREFNLMALEMEPLLREGMAKAYAQHFSVNQLAELNAFFNTPTGSYFAAQQLPMQMDRQVMATIPDMIPVLVGQAAEAGTRVMFSLSEIPQPREVDDLDSAEKARLLDLLGMTQDEFDQAGYGDYYFEEEATEPVEVEQVSLAPAPLTTTPIEGGLKPVQ